MANVFDLLNAAASQPNPTTVQTPVSPTPANVDLYQVAAGMGTDRGMSSASQMEQDLRNLAPNAFTAKYGASTAAEQFAALQQAGSQFSSDVGVSQSRTGAEILADAAGGVASGFLNSIYGPAAAGLGVIDQKAGTAAAKDLESANQWFQGTQSQGINAARRVQAGRTALDYRDNKAEADASIKAGDSELTATLKRMGKDAFDTVVTGGSDPVMFGQGTAEAVGSLLAGGPISKGLKTLGKGAIEATAVLAGAATKAPLAATAAASRVASLGSRTAMPAAIGIMEGGGAYQGTAADIMGMDFSKLEKDSPKFNELVKGGMSKEDARMQLANDAGLTAAAIQAPIAAATGALVSKFEADPFKVPSLRAGLANVLLKEPLEEGLQSASGQLAQNYATKQNADRTLDIAQGVGEQVGMGALYGFGAAGAVQGPGIAKRAVIEGGRATYRGTKKLTEQAVAAGQPLFAAINDRADRIEKQQQKAGPISDDVIRTATNDLIQNQATDIPAMQAAIEQTNSTPEEKAVASDYVTKLGEALQFDAAAEGLDTLPDSGLKNRLMTATDRVDAIQQSARAITEATTKEEQLFGLQVMNMLMGQIDSVKDADPEALYNLPQGPERDAVNRYAKLVNQIENTPAMRNALEKIRNIAQQGEFDSMAPATNEQEARQIVAVADTVPDRGNPEAIDSVLKMAAAGSIQLSPTQLASLRLSSNLIRERQAQEQAIANSGLQSAKDVVSSEVVASNDPLRKYVAPSARQHATRIISAMKSGDVEKAAAFNEDFGLFVQHMQNKVDALNRSFANNGEKMSYQALAPQTRQWFDSASSKKVLHPRLWTDTRSEKSLDLAQSIAAEASTLASIYNNIVETFPEFGQKTIQPVELNKELIGKPSDLISKFASPKDSPTETGTTRQIAQQSVEEVPAKSESAEDTANVTPAETTSVTETVNRSNQPGADLTAETVSTPVGEVTPAKPEPTKIEEVKTPSNPIKAAYPDLHSNVLSQTFSIPKETVRTFAAPNPVEVVQDALMNAEALREFVGDKSLRHTLTPEIAESYQTLLDYVPSAIESGLTENLKNFFAKKNNAQRFLDGEDLVKFDDGKVLALVENVDGNLQFNESLMRSAALAATQWLLVANNYGSRMDAETIAGMLGISEAEVSQQALDFFQNGLSLDEAKQSLSQLVKQFWGMQPNKTALKGYTDGIPEAMAAEMIQVLVDKKLIKKNTDIAPEALSDLAEKNSWTRYVPFRLNEGDALKAYPTAIQDAVLVNPPEVLFLGDAIPPTPNTQMNNPDVELTADQKDAITKESKIPFKANIPLLHFYAAMGKEGFVNGFASGDLNDKRWNQNHVASLKGRNNMAEQSFDSVFDVVAAMANSADGKLADATIRYGFNMSRVGRMQMLGKHNPQSNKFMREVVLPTWADLDMKNGDHQNMFDVAVGQHIGLKIHKLGMEATVVEMARLKNDPNFKAVTDYLGNWIQKTDFTGDFSNVKSLDVADIKQLMTKAGIPMTPGALHAMFELARSQVEKGDTFRTGLYIEADGVTNGPINAMLLMSVGDFTTEWVQNVEKGGISFGAPRPMNQLDKKDMYETSTDHTFAAFRQLVTEFASQSNRKYVLANTNALMNVMSQLLPDVEIKDGQISLKRGIAKNPLTITIYGSGEKGIAGKLTEMVMEELYSKLSEMAQMQDFDSSLTPAEAMFYGDPDAQMKFDKLMDGVYTLANSAVRQSKRTGNYYRQESETQTIKTKGKKSFAEEFTLTGDAKANFEQNMLEIFVKPMRQGIEQTVGKDLFAATKSIQKATDIQSIVMEAAYEAAINERIEERKKEDPNYSATNFLSQQDLDNIRKDMQKRFPLVQSDAQRYLIAKTQRVSSDRFNYSKTLDGQLRTPANYYAPAKAGVMGIAALTIGSGDGMMMQHIAQQDVGTGLKVFDGWNVPLDRAQELNTIANEAVYQSMQGNPLGMVAESFGKFIEGLDGQLDESVIEALSQSLFGKVEETPSVAEIIEGLQALHGRLEQYGKEAAARHTAMTKVAMSVDQMAATESPYHNGVKADTFMTADEAAAALNAEYEKALNPAPVETAAVEKLDTENYGRANKTGVRILSNNSINQMRKAGLFTEAQKVILGEITRSGATKDYTIVTGTAEQIADYQNASGLRGLPQDGSVDGYAVIDQKMIYMVNPSPEILVHELVHAASFENVLAVFNGNQQDATVRDAVTKLEGMMESFLASDYMTANVEANERIDHVKSVINENLTNWDLAPAQAKAQALNEFMAYGLTSQHLTDQFAKAPGLWQMVKDIVKQIKNVIWGRKKAPAVADDFLSQLQFNAGIIIRSQASIANQITNATLYHTSMKTLNERQAEVRNSFANSVAAMFSREGLLPVQAVSDPRWADAQKVSTTVANEMAGRFQLNNAEAATLNMVVAALATEARLDSNALNRAQELYTHVAKNLKVEDLMDPNAPDRQVEEYYAQRRFNAIIGSEGRETDSLGRTTMLSNFIGLTLVSERMRAALKDMKLPKSSSIEGDSLDAKLSNLGTQMMDKLTDRMAGTNNTKTVLAAVDALTDRLSEIAANETDFVQQNALGNAVDNVNNWMVNALTVASDAGVQAGEAIAQKSNTKFGRTAGRLLQIVSGMATEKNGAAVSEGFMDVMNKHKVPDFLFQLANDIVGRTGSNAAVYDMIKKVRATSQQLRQEFRKEVPKVINGKFTRALEANEKATLHKALGRTDIASLLDTMTAADAVELFDSPKKLADQINDQITFIKSEDAKRFPLYEKKAKELAKYMTTGRTSSNLLRNAYAIASLANESVLGRKLSDDGVKAIDRLVTLYAIDSLSKAEKDVMSDLFKTEKEGLEFATNYLEGQRKGEQSKITNEMLRMNQFKGYIPTVNKPGATLKVGLLQDQHIYEAAGYKNAGSYGGSNIVRGDQRAYYIADVPEKASFAQGIIQNVRHTAGGVDANTGYSTGPTAGRITDPKEVSRILGRLSKEHASADHLMPVYDGQGQVVAFEESMEPYYPAQLNQPHDLAEMVGVWRGRQVEEKMSDAVNRALIDKLHAMYNPSNRDGFINLADPKQLDKVQFDATKLFTPETVQYMQQKFGNDEFWVRKDLVDDVIGYRNATVGDFATGNTRWSKGAQDVVRSALITAFGPEVMPKLIKAEQMIQGVVSDIRTHIVVKSVIVPAYNFMSNMYQLMSRGVPLRDIVGKVGSKTAEINSYVQTRERQIALEAELRAEQNPIAQRRLRAEIRSITDSHKRMSIAPLIEAGEFSTIADIGSSAEDLQLSSGKLMSYIEAKVDQLPNGLKTAARYGLVSRDTTLFQGLQKAVQYGDFIAKATLYDDLVKRKGLSSEAALARITEEFVNYDRLPGRNRGYLENIGLLWFYNFKLRITKIALSTLRNNPLHAMLSMAMPNISGVGLPVEDNVITKAFEGSLGYSIGPGMAFNAPTLNPWYNLAN